MKTCPNCKTTGFPDEAKFCPNCGTMLKREEPVKKMTISECRVVPNEIKQGESCRILWKGENVKAIHLDHFLYSVTHDLTFKPEQSRLYNIGFEGEDGEVLHKQVFVTVSEKTTRIVVIKEKMSSLRAFNCGFKLKLILNDKCIAFIPLKPDFQKEIVVKKGDVVKLVEVADFEADDILNFSITITDDILSKSKYYLKYVNHIWDTDEAAFYPA